MNIESVLEVIRMNCLSPSPNPSHQGRGNKREYSIKGGEKSSNLNNAEKKIGEKGFTLIEMIIVIVLISIIAGIAAMIILEGAKSYQKEVSYSDLHNQGRLAIERMAREIRLIRSTSDLTTMAASNIVFNDVNGTNIQFNLAGSALNRSGNTLANNVQSLAFSYYQSDGVTVAGAAAQVWFIQIDLTTVNAGETLAMRMRVHPRNF